MKLLPLIICILLPLSFSCIRLSVFDIKSFNSHKQIRSDIVKAIHNWYLEDQSSLDIYQCQVAQGKRPHDLQYVINLQRRINTINNTLNLWPFKRANRNSSIQENTSCQSAGDQSTKISQTDFIKAVNGIKRQDTWDRIYEFYWNESFRELWQQTLLATSSNDPTKTEYIFSHFTLGFLEGIALTIDRLIVLALGEDLKDNTVIKQRKIELYSLAIRLERLLDRLPYVHFKVFYKIKDIKATLQRIKEKIQEDKEELMQWASSNKHWNRAVSQSVSEIDLPPPSSFGGDKPLLVLNDSVNKIIAVLPAGNTSYRGGDFFDLTIPFYQYNDDHRNFRTMTNVDIDIRVSQNYFYLIRASQFVKLFPIYPYNSLTQVEYNSSYKPSANSGDHHLCKTIFSNPAIMGQTHTPAMIVSSSGSEEKIETNMAHSSGDPAIKTSLLMVSREILEDTEGSIKIKPEIIRIQFKNIDLTSPVFDGLAIPENGSTIDCKVPDPFIKGTDGLKVRLSRKARFVVYEDLLTAMVVDRFNYSESFDYAEVNQRLNSSDLPTVLGSSLPTMNQFSSSYVTNTSLVLDRGTVVVVDNRNGKSINLSPSISFSDMVLSQAKYLQIGPVSLVWSQYKVSGQVTAVVSNFGFVDCFWLFKSDTRQWAEYSCKESENQLALNYNATHSAVSYVNTSLINSDEDEVEDIVSMDQDQDRLRKFLDDKMAVIRVVSAVDTIDNVSADDHRYPVMFDFQLNFNKSSSGNIGQGRKDDFYLHNQIFPENDAIFFLSGHWTSKENSLTFWHFPKSVQYVAPELLFPQINSLLPGDILGFDFRNHKKRVNEGSSLPSMYLSLKVPPPMYRLLNLHPVSKNFTRQDIELHSEVENRYLLTPQFEPFFNDMLERAEQEAGEQCDEITKSQIKIEAIELFKEQESDFISEERLEGMARNDSGFLVDHYPKLRITSDSKEDTGAGNIRISFTDTTDDEDVTILLSNQSGGSSFNDVKYHIEKARTEFIEKYVKEQASYHAKRITHRKIKKETGMTGFKSPSERALMKALDQADKEIEKIIGELPSHPANEFLMDPSLSESEITKRKKKLRTEKYEQIFREIAVKAFYGGVDPFLLVTLIPEFDMQDLGTDLVYTPIKKNKGNLSVEDLYEVQDRLAMGCVKLPEILKGEPVPPINKELCKMVHLANDYSFDDRVFKFRGVPEGFYRVVILFPFEGYIQNNEIMDYQVFRRFTNETGTFTVNDSVRGPNWNLRKVHVGVYRNVLLMRGKTTNLSVKYKYDYIHKAYGNSWDYSRFIIKVLDPVEILVSTVKPSKK